MLTFTPKKKKNKKIMLTFGKIRSQMYDQRKKPT